MYSGVLGFTAINYVSSFMLLKRVDVFLQKTATDKQVAAVVSAALAGNVLAQLTFHYTRPDRFVFRTMALGSILIVLSGHRSEDELQKKSAIQCFARTIFSVYCTSLVGGLFTACASRYFLNEPVSVFP